MATVLSGTSGALYYKPGGTTATFGVAGVDTTAHTIKVLPFLNYKTGDPVKFDIVNSETGATGTGTLPAGLTAATPVYVMSYDNKTGLMKVTATAGGTTEINFTSAGTATGANLFRVQYDSFVPVGDVREWSFEISREEIDVTTIGQAAGQLAPFRRYITGFADGDGTCTVYTSDDDHTIGNRMIQDVLQRQQAGAAFKLYIDRVMGATGVDDLLSRSVEFDAVLTSASLSVNPDDAQAVEINFRPASAPVFDFSRS